MLSPLSAPLDTPRVRGGFRQRRDADSAARSRSPIPVSRGARGHLLSWGKGLESAPGLRQHCLNFVEDGMDHPAVVRLSRIRTTGSE